MQCRLWLVVALRCLSPGCVCDTKTPAEYEIQAAVKIETHFWAHISSKSDSLPLISQHPQKRTFVPQLGIISPQWFPPPPFPNPVVFSVIDAFVHTWKLKSECLTSNAEQNVLRLCPNSQTASSEGRMTSLLARPDRALISKFERENLQTGSIDAFKVRSLRRLHKPWRICSSSSQRYCQMCCVCKIQREEPPRVPAPPSKFSSRKMTK